MRLLIFLNHIFKFSAMKLLSRKLQSLKVVYQADSSLGIENIKGIITVLVSFFIDIVEIFKTKNWFQLVEIIFNLMRFGNIVDVAQEAWRELKDLTQPETEEVVKHITAVLDLENDKTERLIERAFEVIPKVYQLVLDGFGIYNRASDTFQELRSILRGEDEEPTQSTKGLAA